MARTIPSCDCIGAFPPEEVQRLIFCVLLSIRAAVGGEAGSDEYTSTFDNVSADGSIPAGVLGWSITVLSGTVTVQGKPLPAGGSTRGGGYGGKTTSAAIPYTVAGGSVLVAYDTPA